jgi:hypothetical protein
VRSLERLSGRVVEGRYRRVDPNRTRLLFAPTARPVGHGRGYFADYWLFFPFVAVGVGESVTLAGGISLIPGTDQLIYAAPKVTLLNREDVSAGVGILAGTSTGSSDYGGLLYGIGTFGRSERAVSLGVGFAFGNGEMEERPVIMLGGELQVSGSVKLLTENYLVVGVKDGLLTSAGVRFFGDRLAADLGLMTLPALLDEMEGFPFIPIVGFAYNFGPR